MSGIQHTRTTRRPTTERAEAATAAPLRPAVFREFPDALHDTVPERGGEAVHDRGRDAALESAMPGFGAAADTRGRQPVPQRPWAV